MCVVLYGSFYSMIIVVYIKTVKDYISSSLSKSFLYMCIYRAQMVAML